MKNTYRSLTVFITTCLCNYKKYNRRSARIPTKNQKFQRVSETNTATQGKKFQLAKLVKINYKIQNTD